MLQALGAVIIDADDLAREVVSPGSVGLAKVVEQFGASVLLDNGELNRKALAERIFQAEGERRTLESILHPLIAQSLEQKLSSLSTRKSPPPLVAYIVPLLFEKNSDLSRYDGTVVVVASDVVKTRRVMSRDKLSHEQVAARLAAQLSDAEKSRRATVAVNNDGALVDLSEAAKSVFQRFSRPPVFAIPGDDS
jgi:dephospho-CoA kinase